MDLISRSLDFKFYEVLWENAQSDAAHLKFDLVLPIAKFTHDSKQCFHSFNSRKKTRLVSTNFQSSRPIQIEFIAVRLIQLCVCVPPPTQGKAPDFGYDDDDAFEQSVCLSKLSFFILIPNSTLSLLKMLNWNAFSRTHRLNTPSVLGMHLCIEFRNIRD